MAHLICSQCLDNIKTPKGNEVDYMIKCNICNMDHKTDPRALKRLIKDQNACCLVF